MNSRSADAQVSAPRPMRTFCRRGRLYDIFSWRDERAGQSTIRFAELRGISGERTIRWQVSCATAASAVTIQLQTAMNDVDAQ
jgi:hypothetical protein